MQPYEDITSNKPIIDIRMSDGNITKIAPDLAAIMPEKQINEIVNPQIRNFYLNRLKNSTDISNTNKLGASDTDVKNLPSNIGTLALFPQAAQFAETLVPKTSLLSPEEQAFLFFTKMTAEAAKPGATALGAAGAAGEDFIKTRLSQKALESKRAGDVANVASSIFSAIKPKVGAPKSVITDIAKVGNQPKLNAAGKQLYVYTNYGPNGEILGTFEAPKSDASTTVNLGGDEAEKIFGKKKAEGVIKFYEGAGTGDTFKPGVTGQALKASENLNKLQTIEAFLLDPEVKTGVLQDQINAAKLILNRIGFTDFDETAIGKAQNAESLTSAMVLESVSQMKGALSDKELGFLQGMQARIGNTKVGNYLILLSAKHALRKNLEWNDFFKKFKADRNIDPDASALSMGTDTKSNLKLAETLRSKWENFIAKDRDNMYEFLKKDAEKFVNDLAAQGRSDDEIAQAYQDKYTFMDGNKRINALELVEGIFNRTNR
tara:strand:+ start:1418 stop:2884 length:1467 start_codon:yes stop_codon:yes gene_type:complete